LDSAVGCGEARTASFEKRGKSEEATACTISDTREWFDQNVKGDPASASAADQIANISGRSGANNTFPDSRNMHMQRLRKAKLWSIRTVHRATKEKGVWII
jgi:hypothetical protein